MAHITAKKHQAKLADDLCKRTHCMSLKITFPYIFPALTVNNVVYNYI